MSLVYFNGSFIALSSVSSKKTLIKNFNCYETRAKLTLKYVVFREIRWMSKKLA